MPAAPGISYDVIRAEAVTGKYVYEYVVRVPEQPERHLTTVFMVVADCARSARGVGWGRVAATPQLRRGFSADGSRRRRGRELDIPWRRVAADARGRDVDIPRRRVAADARGRDVDIPWRRLRHDAAAATWKFG